jgi:AraC family transcriptional regulator
MMNRKIQHRTAGAWNKTTPALRMLLLLYSNTRNEYLAKIAVELERDLMPSETIGGPGGLTARVLAQGDGWSVTDVTCTFGPQDRPFEERHSEVRVALVTAGSFQYRGPAGRELMTPGSFLLGSPDQYFECAHDHGVGDRCISFGYSPEYFERLTAEAGIRDARPGFSITRLPPLRALAPLSAGICAGPTRSIPDSVGFPWEEISVRLAALTRRIASGIAPDKREAPPSTIARVSRVLRAIERNADSALTLGSLARKAGLSRYHFLRTFERLTGLTPHQYVLRGRLREAARRLAVERGRVTDIALDCGFGDVSNFNRAFRAEFGVSPRGYRRQTNGRGLV